MKRWMRRFCAFLVVCMLLSLLPVAAFAEALQYTDKYGTWTYQEEADGSVTIIGCENTKKNIVIPKMVDGKPVRKLGAGLFKDNATITAVVIPYGVRIMEEDVFFGCTRLERVNLPSSLTAIGDKAFAKCETLTSLFVPSSVEELGDDVFADSPRLNVSCEIDSETARYLKDNKDDVASFTLIDVAVSQDEEPAPAPETQAPVLKGELVTYSFGRTINGEPEYTLVLADSMPELKLEDYLRQDPDADYPNRLDDTLYQIMEQRFQLVSISRYDGTFTETVDCQKDNVYFSVWLHLNYSGSETLDVDYGLSIALPAQSELQFPDNIWFNSDNELVTYGEGTGTGDRSLVEKADGSYVRYGLFDSTSEEYYANGTLIYRHDNQDYYAHRFGVAGSCVEIEIRQNKHLRGDTGEESQYHTNSVSVYDSANKERITAYTHERETAGRTYHSSGRTEYVNDVCTERQYFSATYENGELSHVSQSSSGKGTQEGTYELTDSSLSPNDKWDSTHEYHTNNGTAEKVEWHHEEVNSVYYRENVVRADTEQEAQERLSHHFPNDPDEHSYEVSERTINTEDLSKTDTTTTDLNTGESDRRVNVSSSTYLKDHTYIGDTGMYVGWDWSWHFALTPKDEAVTPETPDSYTADPKDYTASLNYYTVTEYKYSKENKKESWTRTVTTAQPKQDAETGADFQNTVPEKEALLRDYILHSFSCVYDPSVESGMDNWLEIEDESFWYSPNVTPVTPDSPEAQQLAEHIDTILGNSSVEAEGKTLKQQEAREDLLKLAEDLKNPDGYEKDYFKELVEETPDGTALLEEVKEIAESKQLPESNTDKEPDHDHGPDGSVVTENAMSPEPTAAPSDPAAETPNDSIPAESAPEEAAPEETAPEEAAPEETVAEETVSEEAASEETVSEESVPEETASEETASEESAPEELVSEETLSEESASEETTSEEIASEEAASEESVPEETASEESASEETVSEETTSEESASEEAAPVETTSEEIASEEAASEESVPEETASEESASEETVSEETTSEESASEEAAPVETAPEESTPVESASVENPSIG